MIRGKRDQAAAILEVIIRNPNLAPTRLMGKAGINYTQFKNFLPYNLLTVEKKSEKRSRCSITEKGRLFLQHYRVCNQLVPN